MTKENDKKIDTPSEFYRKIRPEYFSDSAKTYEVQLPKEHLAYELSKISTNQKEDAFETLCRKLAERFICPNLIPQVGPSGGGDGKTDAETYPVSESIFERWFSPENGWERDENWAFAFSSKEDWKNKCKGDIKKIVETARGYTRVYFISNQTISSKKKKDAQDEFIKEFKIDVVILDSEWILEKIYGSDLIDLVVDTLNLSEVYKKEKFSIGERDAHRLKKLQEIEERISNPNRYSEHDYQLVEDALESAILTRMLEKPKEEVLAKFDRALRLGKKVNNIQQLARIHYQRAWTFLNWYDAYVDFVNEYILFKKCVFESESIKGVELFFNLFNLLRGITALDDNKLAGLTIDLNKEKEELEQILNRIIDDKDKPSSSLIAKTHKSFLIIFDSLANAKDVSKELSTLKEYLDESTRYIEYPFESFIKIIEIFGDYLPNSKEYDILIDKLASLLEKRASELAAGETFMKRGFQKLKGGFHKESVIYFGRAVLKLAKEESQDGLYLSLRGLQHAYSDSGLYWASYNSLIAATSIIIKEWYNTGKISKRLLYCVNDAVKNELFIGRIPILLNWHELYQIIRTQFEVTNGEAEDITTPEFIDACLAVRLVNTSFEKWSKLSSLPDLLQKETLWISQDTCLYMLGYLELLDDKYKTSSENIKTFDDYFALVASQPFKEQIVYETDFFTESEIKFNSIILGVNVSVSFEKDKNIMLFAEMALAYLESFLATAYSEVMPSSETIQISITNSNAIELFEISNNGSSSEFQLSINFKKFEKNDAHSILLELAGQVIGKNFIMKDAKNYLEQLFKNEELHERQAFIYGHQQFIKSILGEDPKLFLEDWHTEVAMNEYPLKRAEKPFFKAHLKNEEKREEKDPDLENVKHYQRKVSSIIDNQLWDDAKWLGFGFFGDRTIPFGIFLAFENGIAGKAIFENWIKQFGKEDKEEQIRIAIIKNISKTKPNWYRVHVSKKINLEKELQEGNLLITASRFHEMNPEAATNLTTLLNGYNHFKQYWLFPVQMSPDGKKIMPFVDFGILKREMIIKDAWQIGENDYDSAAIRKGDNPLIPDDINDAPILKLLERKNKDELESGE